MICCLEKAREGDKCAREAVVESLRPRLTRMAAYYARRSKEDADDLLQEAWVGLFEALSNVDVTIGTPEQYLIRYARWRLLDSIKRARIRRCEQLDEVDAEQIRDLTLDEAFDEACVSEFLKRLKPIHRAILDCLLAGLTWREAAAVLGCTSANIAYHIRRIKEEYEKWAFSTSGTRRDRD